MPAAADKIWLPGLGVTDVQAARVDKAVNEYDHTLRFGRNEDSGQWSVFIIKRGHKPLPFLGLDEIPHPDDAIMRLYRCDSVRHGKELLGELYSQASKDVPLSAFQLSQPGYMTEFNALLSRNIAGYGTELERWRQNYGANMADYQTALIPWQQNYQTALQAWQFPYQALGSGAALSSALPTGIVSPRGNVAAGALGGLGTGLMAFGPGFSGTTGTGGGKGGTPSLPYASTGAFSSPGMIGRW